MQLWQDGYHCILQLNLLASSHSSTLGLSYSAFSTVTAFMIINSFTIVSLPKVNLFICSVNCLTLNYYDKKLLSANTINGCAYLF